MSTTSEGRAGAVTPPTPEEIGAGYDEFTALYGMTIGDVGLHVGLWTEPGEREPADTLADLANRAQERQTAHHVRTLDPRAHEHVLDIGCGTGLPAVRMAQHGGGRVTGINVSRSHLAAAEETARAHGVADRVTFRHGNAMALDFPDASFDAALSVDVFIHLSDRAEAFRETARVLRPGGHFLLTEFTMRGTPSDAELLAFRQVWQSMAPTTPAETMARAADAGFELVRAESNVANCAFTGDLMGLLYRERHDEIRARYGAELVERMDELVPLVRSFIRDHLGSYLFLLRKPR